MNVVRQLLCPFLPFPQIGKRSLFPFHDALEIVCSTFNLNRRLFQLCRSSSGPCAPKVWSQENRSPPWPPEPQDSMSPRRGLCTVWPGLRWIQRRGLALPGDLLQRSQRSDPGTREPRERRRRAASSEWYSFPTRWVDHTHQPSEVNRTSFQLESWKWVGSCFCLRSAFTRKKHFQIREHLAGLLFVTMNPPSVMEPIERWGQAGFLIFMCLRCPPQV